MWRGRKKCQLLCLKINRRKKIKWNFQISDVHEKYENIANVASRLKKRHEVKTKLCYKIYKCRDTMFKSKMRSKKIAPGHTVKDILLFAQQNCLFKASQFKFRTCHVCATKCFAMKVNVLLSYSTINRRLLLLYTADFWYFFSPNPK